MNLPNDLITDCINNIKQSVDELWKTYDGDIDKDYVERLIEALEEKLRGRAYSESDWEKANSVPEEDLVDEH